MNFLIYHGPRKFFLFFLKRSLRIVEKVIKSSLKNEKKQSK